MSDKADQQHQTTGASKTKLNTIDREVDSPEGLESNNFWEQSRKLFSKLVLPRK